MLFLYLNITVFRYHTWNKICLSSWVVLFGSRCSALKVTGWELSATSVKYVIQLSKSGPISVNRVSASIVPTSAILEKREIHVNVFWLHSHLTILWIIYELHRKIMMCGKYHYRSSSGFWQVSVAETIHNKCLQSCSSRQIHPTVPQKACSLT